MILLKNLIYFCKVSAHFETIFLKNIYPVDAYKGMRMTNASKMLSKKLILIAIFLSTPFILIYFLGDSNIALAFAITSLLLTVLPAFNFMKEIAEPMQISQVSIDYYNVISIAVAFVTVLSTVKYSTTENSLESLSYGVIAIIFILSIFAEMFYITIIKPNLKNIKK